MKEWTQFARKIIIDRSVSDIYPMWATSKGLTTWFLSLATYQNAGGEIRDTNAFYQSGDTYRWEWHNWEGSASGKVLAQNGVDCVKFDFESSVVEVTLEPFHDGRTLVSLLQSKIAEDDDSKMQIYCGCSSGWTFWLTNLKAYLEHGILLNEKAENVMQHFEGYELVNT